MANTSTRSINPTLQRDRLIRAFQQDKKHGKSAAVEAIPLKGTTPGEVGGEARDKGCDYILYTELVELRTGGDPQQQNQQGSISIGKDPLAQYPSPPYMNEPVFQATVNFHLNRVADPEPQLSSSVRTLEHTDEDETVSRLLGQIVSRVKSEIGARSASH